MSLISATANSAVSYIGLEILLISKRREDRLTPQLVAVTKAWYGRAAED